MGNPRDLQPALRSKDGCVIPQAKPEDETDMASKTTLNAKNLEALGAERLASLLIEISTGSASAKRRLRLELAGAQGAGEVARQVRKRLMTIARSRSHVDWQQRKALVGDLETQRRAIVDEVGRSDPAEALDLMWRFLALANPVFGRCDDSSGTVIGIFHGACDDLGDLAKAAGADSTRLADQVFEALLENDYGQYDELIAVLAPSLGQTGLDHLKVRLVAFSQTPPDRPGNDAERQVIGWGSGGPVYADEIEARRHDSTVRLALEAIADAQGDVDAFIAQQSEAARTVPAVAAEIAQRLLEAGRANEAWTAINRVDDRRSDRLGWIPYEWEETRLAVMEALGRADEAQAYRWACFERRLSVKHLRAYLRQLPDFDDVEAEDRALAHALAHADGHEALVFLLNWPALDKAAALVLQPERQWNGDHFELLTPAAEALAGKYPLAATRLLRAMIDFALERARVKRYRHAARHLAECAGLAAGIESFGELETHEAYVARLKSEHGRKTSFWTKMP